MGKTKIKPIDIMQNTLHNIARCLVDIHIDDLKDAEKAILFHLKRAGFVTYNTDKSCYEMTGWH